MIGSTFILLATLVVSQAVTADGWKTCPNGAQYRVEKDCPRIGPHPTIIYFDRGATGLTERSVQSLDGLAHNWHAYRRGGGTDDVSYLMLAYSDRSEAEADDLPLSRGRAGTARQYLISKGLPRESINIMLAGPSRPQPAENHGESEADNRRVVVWAIFRQALR